MDSLIGSVERITYYNPENGYTVLRLLPQPRPRFGDDDTVTVVGNLPDVQPGEHLKLTGRWTTHTDYGKQFVAEQCEQTLPATAEGIRRYLGSGLIKGIGPRTADKIVQTFGAETLYVIDSTPQRLREVPDIGAKRYGLITAAWETQKAIKDVMVFLQSHGISTSLAVKIYKQYGDESLAVVQNNPYQLARDIWGVGFKTADKLAQALGMALDAPARLEAGLLYALSELADDGHVYAPQSKLFETTAKLLDLTPPIFTEPLAQLVSDAHVHTDTLPDLAEPAIYLTPFYHAEVNAAARLTKLIGARDLFGKATRLADLQTTDWTAQLAARDKTLSDEQRQAVQIAITHKVSVLTGGPGTGKTTALRALIQLLEQHHPVALTSPTGRAAKRLSEATGKPAQTLHRLLGFSPTEGFTFNEQNRLSAHLVVVDEVSMLDILLFNNLLKAVDPAAHLLLVGDVDQLPSVGAGDVLRDVVASGCVPVTRLSHIFRQAADSHIITNAQRINHGQMPVFTKDSRDFFLFAQEDPEQAAAWVVDVVTNRIPRKFGLDPLEQVQVLTPMRRGAAGVNALNAQLQAALNPPAPNKAERAFGGRILRVGDRVMQIRNNYTKDVFNGDIGRIVAFDTENQTLTVTIDGRSVLYEWLEVDELQHAFAVSIHKAQGSEFPAVVIPLVMQHYMLLQRNLLYTGITRAKQVCVIVGARKAIAMAVKNANVNKRWSGLAARLKAR